jgi:hypothetical protein
MKKHSSLRSLSLLNPRIRGEFSYCSFGRLRPYPALGFLAAGVCATHAKHLIGIRRDRCETVFLYSGAHMAVYRFALNVT